MKVVYKVLRILIPVAIVATVIYFLARVEQPAEKQLLNYLDNNAVAYHLQSSDEVSNILGSIDPKNKHNDLKVSLPDSSILMHYFTLNDGIISWHLTRQKTLAKVYWVFVHDQYNPNEDSLLVSEPINKIYQVKVDDEKYFVAVSSSMVAIGTNGEIIEQIGEYDFFEYAQNLSLHNDLVKGSWSKLQEYLKSVSDVFNVLDLDAKTYIFDYYKGARTIFYTLKLGDIRDICMGLSKANFNGSLPKSTVAVWQKSFADNNCLLNKHTKDIQQELFELEERYSIKVSSIMDAWFDGSFRSVYCDFNGMHAHIGAVRLKDDAAPFASGSRFFVDYDNIKVGNDVPQKNFTIARVIPEGLSKIVFPAEKKSTSLFVTQYKSHLYFAQKREPLVLLLNEMITGNSLSLFDEVVEAQHHFFFRFPYVLNFGQNDIDLSNDKGFLIQGKSILQRNELIFQGQFVFE